MANNETDSVAPGALGFMYTGVYSIGRMLAALALLSRGGAGRHTRIGSQHWNGKWIFGSGLPLPHRSLPRYCSALERVKMLAAQTIKPESIPCSRFYRIYLLNV